MKNPKILIFDPYLSVYKNYLESIITERTNYKTITCRRKEDIKSLTDKNFILIFAFFENENQVNGHTFNQEFFKEFDTIPKVGIIKSCLDCKKCPSVRKELCNFITVPFDEKDILNKLDKFVDSKDDSKIISIQSFLKNQARCKMIEGRSESMSLIRAKIRQIVPYNVNVLITGETGTGKELCARMIHFLSPRAERPFVAVNCGAIPKELFENELFGHKKGAYTDANTNEIGLVSAANGGTLFLDEIESLSHSAQIKLLRFLEEKKYKPLGQAKYIESDVRVIAAANENLYELSKENLFRKDLFYRLAIVEIYLPPLRERKEDIPGLVSYFIEKYSNFHNKTIKGIKDDFLMNLLQYDWPGNVRELENVIQEIIVTNESGWISADDLNLLKFHQQKSFVPESFQEAKQRVIENFEKSFLQKTLDMFNGNIKKAAYFAQKDRRAFYNLMNKYNIDPDTYRS